MADEPPSVDTYRIEQLEKELADLKSEAKTLSFEQVRQMFTWLGLPVVLATGVFGIALWQSIETSTLTAAEKRADRKVAEITNDIDALSLRVTDLAARAQSTIEELREIRGRADATATSVRDRLVAARESVGLAEQELISLKRRIAAVPDVASLSDNIEDAAAKIAVNDSFQGLVAGKVLGGLDGLVAAFDLQDGCPPGWTAYQEAAGRMIIGVGQGEIDRPGDQDIALTERFWRNFGGAETHTLTVEEMPRHRHQAVRDFAGGDSSRGVLGEVPREWGNPPKVLNPIYTEYSGGQQPDEPTKPHNNMPPYIALYFCKKEAG